MFLLPSSDNEYSTISANAVSVLLLKPVDVFLFRRYWYTDSFSPTTLAQPGRLGLCLSFTESFEASNLKISFSTAQTLQNSEIYNEIDTTTLKCQLKIHTSAFRSLTAAMEEDINPLRCGIAEKRRKLICILLNNKRITKQHICKIPRSFKLWINFPQSRNLTLQIRLHNNQENGGFFIYGNCTWARKALWVTLAL